MKVLFASTLHSHPWRGSEALWSRTALSMLSMGHSIAAFIDPLCVKHPSIQEIEQNGGEIHTRSAISDLSPFQRLKRKLNKNKAGINIAKFPELVSKFKPDLVCISNTMTMDRPWWVEHLTVQNIPFVNISQSNDEHLWPNDSDATQLRKLSKKALKMCFVSERNKKLFETQIVDTLDNTFIVRNPFNVDFSKTYDWPKIDAPTTLALIGYVEPRSKGHDILIDVMKQQKWRNRPIVVECYGTGQSLDNFKRLIKMYDLSQSIRIMGSEQNPEKIWDHCHALILPSRLGGLPLVIVEAMLVARPVITTDVAGNAEFLVDNETGFIAQSATLAALDKAMERSWNARSNWEAMGRKASEAIRKKIPANPPKAFANLLLEWLDESKKSKRHNS